MKVIRRNRRDKKNYKKKVNQDNLYKIIREKKKKIKKNKQYKKFQLILLRRGASGRRMFCCFPLDLLSFKTPLSRSNSLQR